MRNFDSYFDPPEPAFVCQVCGMNCDDCVCPECPQCGERGRPECVIDHGLSLAEVVAARAKGKQKQDNDPSRWEQPYVNGTESDDIPF